MIKVKIDHDKLLEEAMELADEIDDELMVAVTKSIIKNVITDEDFVSVIDTITLTAFTVGRVYERLLNRADKT